MAFLNDFPSDYCVSVCYLLSHVWLFLTPWTVASQAPPSVEFSRQECWSGWPYSSPGDLPRHRDLPTSLMSLASGRFFTISATWEAYLIVRLVKNHLQCRRPWFDSWVGKILWRGSSLSHSLPTPVFLGFPGGSAGNESTCNVGELGSIPGLGRSPGEGKGYPRRYSDLGNLQSRTLLSGFHFTSLLPGKPPLWFYPNWPISCLQKKIVWSPSCAQLFVTLWTAAHQASP